ncbi:MAG: hypothetical protein H8E53_11040 [Planctomycetes bacterium]|nr:hypothetical protein [Planctomycetota bacterium]
MSPNCTNRCRLKAARSVVIVAAAVILQTVAVYGGVKTVIGGRRGRGPRTVIGMGRSTPQPQPVRGTASAYFAGWGTLTENGTTRRTISVAIDDARRVQKMILANENPDGAYDPGKHVKKLSETLKIGDAVGFHFLIANERVYAAGITLNKPLPGGSGAAPFTLIGSKTVRSGRQSAMFLTANAGVIPCTFRVADEVDENGKSRPSRKVTEALKQFCRGDLLELEYKTVNFQFVVTGVKAAIRSGQGMLTKITSRKLKGYKHMVTLIKTSKRTMTLTDPQAVIELNLKNVANPTPDPPVQTMLKALTPGDYVMFKYRRQRGVYWLEEIYPTSRPTTRPSHAANRIE